jgi:hypothetical protein
MGAQEMAVKAYGEINNTLFFSMIFCLNASIYLDFPLNGGGANSAIMINVIGLFLA